MSEIWRPIEDERIIGLYEISNIGNVRSLDRTYINNRGTAVTYYGKVIKLMTDRHGYQKASLKPVGIRQKVNFLVSRLVAEAFCEKTAGCNIVNHIDGNKMNNAAHNLEWTTIQGNTQHSYDAGLQVGRKGKKHHFCKLNESDVLSIITSLSVGASVSSLAQKYQVTRGAIRLISIGKNWRHVKVDGLSPPYAK